MKFSTVETYFNKLPETERTEILRRSSPISDYLYELIKVNRFKNILEIGTFKGRNTMYMAASAHRHKGKVTTINISQEEMAVAEKLISGVGLENVTYEVGDSLALLEGKLSNEVYDFVFIDGNHSFKYSYNEYRLVSQNMENGLIIFDDAVGVHCDSRGDGGVPKTVIKAKATLYSLPRNNIGYKIIGHNDIKVEL